MLLSPRAVRLPAAADLRRYTQRVALTNRWLVSLHEGVVRFQNYADGSRGKVPAAADLVNMIENFDPKYSGTFRNTWNVRLARGHEDLQNAPHGASRRAT